MKKFLNSEGSIWRKWDLHVHSPASKLHNEFSSWDEYIDSLEVLEDISVLGITDYYSIEGYLKVMEYKGAGRLNNIDLILPNVEMRIDTVTSSDRPINIHVIFSPNIVDQINDKFFRELKYEYAGNTFSCTYSDLIELGKMTKNSEISNDEALKEGMNQFKVSIDKLKTVFSQNKNIFENNVFTVVANKSTDGASGIRGNSMQMEQRKIYQFADAVFSSRPGDRVFFLGKASNHPKEKIIENYGSLKPCIHGSDAHKIEKICKPDMNRFTWIKADPSFNGLLQVIHEPEKRVIIQENNPDLKSDYNIIKSIRFIDNNEFTSEEIMFNPGLNTIIGGKSSGKSLLLYKIAQAISKDEIEIRTMDEKWKNPYSTSFIEDVEFEVIWRNGDSSNNFSESKGKVTYIPQMYINSLSEETANKDLQKKIEDILMQNEEHSRFLTEKRDQIKNYSKEVKFDIGRLFEKIQDLITNEEKTKKEGNKDAVEKEYEKLQKLIEERIKSSNISPEGELEMKQYENEKKELQNLISERKQDNEKGLAASKELNSLVTYFNTSLKDLTIGLPDEYLELTDKLSIQINEAFVNTLIEFDNKTKTYNDWNKLQGERIVAIEEKLRPYQDKLKGLSDISQLQQNLSEQEKLINQLETLEDINKNLKLTINQIKEGIFNTFENYLKTLLEIKNYFNNRNEFSNLTLQTDITFEEAKFEESFLSLFNRRGKISNLFPDAENLMLFDENDQFIFEIENYLSKLKHICEMIIQTDETKLKLRKSFTRQDAVEHLFNTGHTKIVFDFLKDGDSLNQMSPGKRGLVLLELFLEMSDEKHPILIDQPEDNLDNRTISKDLVDILKRKKDSRQIIIVTHNANLVVLTDSENVIVANQDGQLIENANHRFEYLTGAMECDFKEDDARLDGKGIKTHVCEILEGGKEAFEIREKKYGF
ncbi:hypothetical protein J1P26_23745 [Neobacillus sp. MM2021_6]|uniref:TrlF family AAA-like ATPase n=1 Tax=Bacillaceae TaxID=186817 RepID=UPI001407C88F|nr:MULTISPECIES: hypothetical protein [Bacillaceae]MBO0962713.1 hypothetical protein [Neobacillus sp. MM2021_6]NHC21503.1 hypothetical protein [Bacillus sp. MM2020_4]